MDGRKERRIEIHPQKESEMNGKRRRKLGTVVGVTALLAALSVPTSLPASAVEVPDQVLAWNQHAYNELIVVMVPPLNGPPAAVLHLGMVHGAIYDAVNAIDGGYDPYLVSPSASSTYSEDAAAATAGYRVLEYLLPSDRDDELLGYHEDSLEAILDAGVSQTAIDGGVTVGEAAATAMIAARTGDGRYGPPTTDPAFFFTEGTGAGDWRNLVAPLSPMGNNFKWVGNVEPFMIPNAASFATPGPLELTSAKYAAEFDEVKALGRATGSTRTGDQTAMAHFWADHAVAMWTRIFRQIAEKEDLSTTENARYFAMLYLTGSDALIACFQDKERHSSWRPQTAIHLAGIDGNPATVADGSWTSVLGNPPYSDHPSGHTCVSNSFVETLRDFFGTNQMVYSATRATSPIGAITRHFTRFSQAIREVRLARVYGGIHFMTADAQGATLGRKVAMFRQRHYFQPVD
ncbi:MAG TPA: PA-phosphatase [Actinomycetota bacterium]|nr:PA-phosphatase [Actinomycetota bacterium]